MRMEKILPPKKKKVDEEERPEKLEVEQAQQALMQMNARPATPEEKFAFAEARVRLAEARRREEELREEDDKFWEGPEGQKLERLFFDATIDDYIDEDWG